MRMSKQEKKGLVPEQRFPEFRDAGEWQLLNGDNVFDQISNKYHNSDLPILAITQEYGAIPREEINYHVSVTDKSIESYKVVETGDFIISLRSFQGGIEYSNYKGLCSPAYVILRKKIDVSNHFYKQFFKTNIFIQSMNKNIEGIRDGKMVSYKQFSELLLPYPFPNEQQKIADCFTSIDELITTQTQKLEALKTHKKGLMQYLFPAEGETVPRLRFPEFRDKGEWEVCSIEKLVYKEIIFPPKDGNHGNIHPKSSDYVEYGIPFVMANDIKNGNINLEGCSHISKAQADSLQKGFAKEGDVLFTHKGTVGEVAVINKIEFPYLMLTPQVTYYRVIKKESLLNKFLSFSFCSERFKNKLSEVSGGGTRAYIGITEQRKLVVVLPPELEEQQKIADCLSSIDELITAQSQKLKSLMTHKKGLMQQLFPTIDEVNA